MTNDQYLDLLEELDALENQGVRFDVDGDLVTPLDVIQAHMVREDNHYMREYVEDNIGVVKKVKFTTIRH